MPGSRLYNFTLKQPQFEITPFQAVAFEPKDKVNVSLLSDSFSKIEERRRAFNEKQAGLIKMFGDLSDKLVLEGPGSEAQVNWWNDFQNGYKKSLEEWSNSGDLAGALEVATNYAAEAFANKELHARMQASSDYRDYIKQIEEKVYGKNPTISEAKYLWWKHSLRGQYKFDALRADEQGIEQNLYHDNIVYDNEGNMIYNGRPFNEPLYEDFNPANFALIAEKLINPDTTTTATSSEHSSSHYVDGTGSSKSSGSSREYSETVVSPDDVLLLEKTLANYIPDFHKQVQQQRDFELTRYLETQKRLIELQYPNAYRDEETNEPIVSEDGTKYMVGTLNDDGMIIPLLDENGQPVWQDVLELDEFEAGKIADYANNIVGPNGNIKTREEYYRDNVYNPIFRAAVAYRNTTSRRSSSSSKSSTKTTNNGGNGGNGGQSAYGQQGYGQYSPYPMYYDYSQPGNPVQSPYAGPSIISLFNPYLVAPQQQPQQQGN